MENLIANITLLFINGLSILNIPIKRHRMAANKKKWPTYMLLTKIWLQLYDSIENKSMAKLCHANNNENNKKKRGCIHICQIKLYSEENYQNQRGTLHNNERINPSKTCVRSKQQNLRMYAVKLLEPKDEIDSSTLVVADFHISLYKLW